MMKIEIQKYRKFDDGGAVRGICSISIHIDSYLLSINGVKVVKSKNGIFYGMPQTSYTDRDGEKKYSSICGFFDKESYAVFHKSMTKAFTEYFEKEKASQNFSDFLNQPSPSSVSEEIPF